MGVLPLQFEDGSSAKSLGLTGFEVISITGIGSGITPRQIATCRSDTQMALAWNSTRPCGSMRRPRSEYFRHGGILQMVLRQLLLT